MLLCGVKAASQDTDIDRHRHRHTREDPCEDPLEDPCEDVGVGVDVDVVECDLNGRAFTRNPKGRGFESRPVHYQVTT